MVYSALFLISLLFVVVFSQEDLPCLEYLTEDITHGTVFTNGSILKNNVTYNVGNYYKNNNRIWGCICNVVNCVQMCCGVNEVFANKTCVNEANHSEINISGVFDDTNKLRDFSQHDFFRIKSFLCPKSHARIPAEESDSVYIQENGSLYLVSKDYEAMYDPGYYCLTRTPDNALLTVLCEFYDEQIEESMRMYAKGNNLIYH